MIKPTVGRVVLYHPHHSSSVCAGMIAHVNEDGTLNIGYLDMTGSHYSKMNVVLVQDGEAKPDSDYCEWMSFQIGQAARTEAVEASLKRVWSGESSVPGPELMSRAAPLPTASQKAIDAEFQEGGAMSKSQAKRVATEKGKKK